MLGTVSMNSLSEVQPDPVPSVMPAAPAVEPIDFAKRYHLQSRLGKRSLNIKNYFVMGSLFVSAEVFTSFLTRLGIPWFLAFLLLPASMFFAYGCWYFVTRPVGEELAPWLNTPETPDSTVRVACCGKPQALTRLARKGRVENIAFEPMVYRGVAALKLRLLERWAWGVVSVMCVVLLYMLAWWLSPRVANGYVVFVTAFAVGGIVTTCIWPTYFRLVPGRIDVLRYNTLGRNVMEVVKHDLRTSAVLVDLNQRCVFLAKDGITTEIGFGAVRDPYEFAHAVLLAAVSTHTPAPLPDDALIG